MIKADLLSKIENMQNTPKFPKGSSAVIIPLVEIENEMHILFEQRASTLDFQPGDVCFPGGRIEEGETPRDAAIREFSEELHSNDIEILAALSPLMGPTAAPVYPFVALVKNQAFSYSEDEVARVFTYSIDYLKSHPPVSYPMQRRTMPPDNFPYEKVTGGKSTYNWHVQRYDMWVYEDTDPVIWGFTGRLLQQFLSMI